MHLAHALLAQNRAEEAASVLFSAFGNEAYYQQADYRNAAIQALRLCPDSVKLRDVNQVLRLRAGLDDQALFEAFLAEKRKFLR
jgi:predicted N-acetyltransferase YhbS